MALYKECMKTELDIFDSLSIQSNILRTEEVSYKPIASLDSASTIEFSSIGNGDTYRDLSSIYLKLMIQIYPQSSSDTGIVNNILHSLFRQCAIYLNGKPISQTDVNYHYRAYIENLLNYGNDAATTHLESSGWILDQGQLDSLVAKENAGLDARKRFLAGGVAFELMGKIHGDLLNQPKFLLNGVDLRIVLSLEKPEFYMMEGKEGVTKIKILDATLYLNHVTLNPNILMAHQQVLEKKNAVYPYKRIEVKSYTIPSGAFTLSLDNVVLGLLPNLLLFCMVDNDAYTGNREKNPFNFKHNKITRFNLVVNGVQVPNQPLEFDFTKLSPISTRGYNTLFKGTGIHYFDKGHQITKKFFDEGCFILAFDLTPDHSYNSSCGALLNEGTVRIEGRFSEALPNSVTCIVYAEYDANIEINSSRNIITSF